MHIFATQQMYRYHVAVILSVFDISIVSCYSTDDFGNLLTIFKHYSAVGVLCYSVTHIE